MGVIADIKSNTFTTPPDKWERAGGIDPLQGSVKKYLDHIQSKYADPAPKVDFTTANGVVTQAQSTMTAGNHTLTVTVRQANGVVESFTTGNILWNAPAATATAALDGAATGVITGWTAGDITVGGVAVNDAGGLSYTFDGASVAGRLVTMSLNNVNGTGGVWGAQTQTTLGQSARPAWAFLEFIGAIAAPIPDQGSISPITAGTGRTTFKDYPNDEVLKALCLEATLEDAHDLSTGIATDVPGLYDALLEAVGIDLVNSSSFSY